MEIRFCGHAVSAHELKLIEGVISSCKGLRRTEFASTVYELLGWRRANGGLSHASAGRCSMTSKPLVRWRCRHADRPSPREPTRGSSVNKITFTLSRAYPFLSS